MVGTEDSSDRGGAFGGGGLGGLISKTIGGPRAPSAFITAGGVGTAFAR